MDNLLGFGPLVWSLGDDLLVFMSGLQGFSLHSLSKFISRFSHCPMCLFVVVFMSSRQRMRSRRGDGNNIGHKRVLPFSYDIVASSFDVFPLEVRREILVLENKEAGDHPYFSYSELVGEDVK